jgi:UDP-N-acetylglucosamine transferase subunit ALG13
MQQKGAISVLLAPLDWGLGHATRCIPIIKQLIQQGSRVVIAASGSQKILLEQEFPNLEFLDLPGYAINYKPGILLKWGLVFQIPSILKQIKSENKWLEQIRQQYSIDAVISDNRYGLHNKNLFCVFITHQLFIQSGSVSGGSWRNTAIGRWIDRKIMNWNYSLIEKFSSCWVPDQEAAFSIAGLLSHPPVLPKIPIQYIGLLSRFQPPEKQGKKNLLLILLSGPEPQRTQFEKILFKQLTQTTLETFVLRGLPGKDHQIPFIKTGIEIRNHASTDELSNMINESAFIIARAGYSTIMDLIRMKKNAILVPTPGQTEQEYLGHYLHEKKWMYTIPQKNFSLQSAIRAFQNTQLQLPEITETKLQIEVERFLKEIFERKYVNQDRM